MPAIGDTLAGRYRIDALLGSGGMATVYRGRDLRLDRDVAIKVLLANRARDESVAERFDREARAMAAVRHPAIVSIFDVEPADPPSRPEPFLVMELCEGGSLAAMIASAGVVPPDDLIPIIIAVAGGLAELHGRGVVHRDVKPHNILLASDGARLGDLGVAQTDAVDADALTSVGETVGTLAYLAPELLSGASASPASDVYGLAASTYQALTGRLPRPTGNLADLVASRSSPIVRPSVVAPVLGEAFDAPLLAAMSPDPHVRPSALELATELTSSLGRWSRDTSRTTLPPAPDADATTVMAIPTAPDSEATTVPAIPAAPARAAEPPVARRPSMASAIGIGLVLLAVGVVALIGSQSMLGGGTSGGQGLGPSGSPVLPAPSRVPPSASPVASPVRSGPPSTDPLAGARAAIRDLRAAILAAKGGREGLKGKEANALDDAVNAVERALDEGNLGDAARRADELVRRVDDLIRKRDVSGQQADQLRAAALALRAAIGTGYTRDAMIPT